MSSAQAGGGLIHLPSPGEDSMRSSFLRVASAAALLAVAAPLQAQVTQLNFEGIVGPQGETASIGSFYNSVGVEFLGNALALCSRFETRGVAPLASCEGNFQNQPAPGTSIMFFLTSSQTGFNFASGFTTGFSFFYTSPFETGSLQIFDGLNGSGSLLASLDLATTPNPPGCPTFACRFDAAGVGFDGTARSVIFAGVANRIGFDNVTFGSRTPTPVPEPASAVLLAAGALGLLGIARRRTV
jgi:hypothetical protein